METDQDRRETIQNVMLIFSEEYGEKFTVSESRMKIWQEMLVGSVWRLMPCIRGLRRVEK